MRRRPERGSAVADFVLVMVVLIPVFLGVLQVALVLHVRNTLASAANEGARVAATVDRSDADGVAYARHQIQGAISGRYAGSVTAHSTSVGGAPAVRIEIRAEVPALGLGGPGVALTVSGRAVHEAAG